MKKLKTLLFFFLFVVALMINGALQAQNSPVKNSVLKARALEIQKKINEDHKKKIKTRA